MQTRTVERVETWESRPYSGGAAALASLSDADFSGAVVADDVWLFFVNGRPVGVSGGTVDDVAASSGTAYEAPDLSLPLLFAMQEADGETRAQYYTNDTPLTETDATLEDAGFTGYVELSEDVLSGDYYVAYYGGRSLPVAFVGNAPEVVTGADAFERAADEVGVYEVVSVDLAFPDLPEVEADEASAEAAAGAAVGAASDGNAGAETDAPTGTADTDESSVDDAPADANADDPLDATAALEEAATADGATGDRSTERPTVGASARDADDASADTPSDAVRESGSAGEPEGVAGRRATDAETPRPSADPPAEAAVEQAPTARAMPEEEGDADESADAEATRREATRVPALAPEEDDAERAATDATDSDADDATDNEASAGASEGESEGRVEALQRELAAREERIEGLEERLADAEETVAARERDLEDVRAERDELRETVERLEERIATLEADLEAAQPGPGDLSPAEALAGTNLFVRYESKADPTLADLEEAEQSEIDANLTLEHHTTFDASGATVDGEPYESFLESTAAYRFVSWVVRGLPREVLAAGHSRGLADLYEAIPEIDRAELDGTVELEDETGEATRHDFDVVLRDRMGDPLVVAALNTSRDPVTGAEMEALTDAASAVGELADSLGAALYVTASFFEPGALEVAGDATASGGLLRRSEKESYVKVSRKRGYHLCLVEDRNGSFHVTVPEL
ncbi:hypothetical protein EFA46_009255 [Halarchaeum sp. CBA1220]|uniref:DUF7527 domain-containing protein n=1 Tax=Halarchaeum sp. CBA1220 TaxID=1853682 RepID=UPI000F3A86E8|nr:hypothetical protein [Halarchaeum sp. CBA1220]QLC34387.1 hypothetical protein EFA46_009255 [Halarchaeum sp. CBA1220]